MNGSSQFSVYRTVAEVCRRTVRAGEGVEMNEEWAAMESRGSDMSDEAIREVQQRRFRERVQRVLEAMQRERVDWRGLPFIAADGRIGVRVVPVETTTGSPSQEQGQT